MSKYDDIMNMDQPPLIRRRMLNQQRAAQFAPFAALTGYEEIIKETSRLVEPYRELDEQQQNELNHKLQAYLNEPVKEPILLIYFVPDMYKEGGHYIEESVVIIKMDELHQQILLEDGRKIPFVDVYDINR